MIFLILILAIVSPSFAYPANDLTEIKTEQQVACQQVYHGSPVLPHGEIKEVQKLQVINQADNVQPIIEEVNSNREVVVDQVQSTADEEAQKVFLQPAQQISKISDSVREYPNVQLVQLEPITSDLVLPNDSQQTVLLPYITANQIQPFSEVPVKQVHDVNPGAPAGEVTNVFIIPILDSTDQKNTPIDIYGQNQVPHASLIHSSEVPHPQSQIPNVEQVAESAVESQKQVQNFKAENVNSLQTVQQNEKPVQEEIQIEKKENIVKPSPVQPQDQVVSTLQGINTVQSHVKDSSQSEVKAEQPSNQDLSAAVTQYGNAPQVQALNEQSPYQQKVHSEISHQIEEQANQRQFNIKEEIERVQTKPYQEVLHLGANAEQHSHQHSYQETSKVES